MKKTLFILLFLIVTKVFSQNKTQNSYYIADNYFKNNEFNKAIVIYKKLIKKNPYSTIYLKRLISCYQEIDSFFIADKFLKKKLKQKPKLTYLNVLLGFNYEKQHKLKEAKKYYNKAIESINENSFYVNTIANMLRGYGKLDMAIKAYKKSFTNENSKKYSFNIAKIYGEKGDFDKMFKYYMNFAEKNSMSLRVFKRITAQYITDDSENENNILFKKALLKQSASNPKDIWNNLLSWLFTKQKEYEKAFIQEKALYARDSNNLYRIKALGEIAFENKNYITAKKCFEFIITKTMNQNDKFQAISKKLLISIEMKDKNVDEQFNLFFKKNGFNSLTLPIQIIYSNYLTFEKNNSLKGLEILKKAINFAKSKFLKAQIKMQIGDILVYQNKFNQALIYFSQVQLKFKNYNIGKQAKFKVAQTSYFKNDFKWAKAQLKVLKASASQLIANDAADLFLIISDNQPKDSTDFSLKQYSKADLYFYQKKYDKALSILNNLKTNFKGQAIEDDVLYKLANIFIKEKQYKKGIENYKKIINLNKKSIYIDDAYYFIAEIYRNNLNDKEKAKEYYKKIIFNHPNSIYLIDSRKRYRKLRGDNID